MARSSSLFKDVLRMLYYQSTTKAEEEQVEIYKALGLSYSTLRGCKTII